MKTKIKIWTLFIFSVLTAGCREKDEPGIPAVSPQFSQPSVTVETGQQVEVEITKGVPSYTATSSSTSVATATVSGEKIIITGITAGTAEITVKGKDGGISSPLKVTVTADPYKDFKADATLRFEGAGQPAVKNEEGKYVFYADRGILFSSTRNKFGYASRDGTAFYFIEWEGDAAAGAKTNASIRNSSGGANLQTLQIIQSEDNRVWIVYKENADSEEGRVVQKW